MSQQRPSQLAIGSQWLTVQDNSEKFAPISKVAVTPYKIGKLMARKYGEVFNSCLLGIMFDCRCILNRKNLWDLNYIDYNQG